MSLGGLDLDLRGSRGLLIDTNLLVLFTVGTVNRKRIETFKRTRQYSVPDFELLIRVMDEFHPLYGVAHVAAEVSNLTDLAEPERLQARHVLREMLQILKELVMASVRAGQSRFYERLGLADGAIEAVAREQNCAVLTDDLDLYLALQRDGIPALNFTRLRELAWGL